MATKAVISAVSCRSSGRATAGGQHGWYIWMPRLPRGVGAYGPRPSIQRTLHTSPPRLYGHGEALALSSRRPNCPRPACPRRPPRAHAKGNLPRCSRRVSHLLFERPTFPSRTYCVVMALAGTFRSCWLFVCQPAPPALSQQPHLPLRRSTRSFHARDASGLGQRWSGEACWVSFMEGYDGSLSPYDVDASGRAVPPRSGIGLSAKSRIM